MTVFPNCNHFECTFVNVDFEGCCSASASRTRPGSATRATVCRRAVAVELRQEHTLHAHNNRKVMRQVARAGHLCRACTPPQEHLQWATANFRCCGYHMLRIPLVRWCASKLCLSLILPCPSCYPMPAKACKSLFRQTCGMLAGSGLTHWGVVAQAAAECMARHPNQEAPLSCFPEAAL